MRFEFKTLHCTASKVITGKRKYFLRSFPHHIGYVYISFDKTNRSSEKNYRNTIYNNELGI